MRLTMGVARPAIAYAGDAIGPEELVPASTDPVIIRSQLALCMKRLRILSAWIRSKSSAIGSGALRAPRGAGSRRGRAQLRGGREDLRLPLPSRGQRRGRPAPSGQAGRQVIGAMFSYTFNGRACSAFSGSTPRGYEAGAQVGLYWEAARAFKAEGFAELNWGGVPAFAENPSHPMHGLYLFKARRGTAPLLCRSGSKVLSPLRDRLARLREAVRR